ncbi:MAG: UPF0175 family protein [Cyanobacteria bacterium P01_F01_bin.150]
MQITVDIPDSVTQRLRESLPHSGSSLEEQCRVLLLIYAYRSMLLSGGRLKELLGLDTTLELDALLQEYDVDLHYDADDFERNRQTLLTVERGQPLTA